MAMDLTELVQGKNLILAGGVFALTTTIRTALKPFFDSHLGERLLPLLPILLGVAGALGGVCEGATTPGDKMLLGTIIGFSASHIYKMGRTSLMGFGTVPSKKKKAAAEKKAAELAVPATPATPADEPPADEPPAAA